MRAEYVNPVMYSVMETLAKTTRHKPHLGKVKLKKHALAQGAVTGLVNLQIGNAVGSLALSFSRELILSIASEVTNKPVRRIDNSVLNVAGRLTYQAGQGARQYLPNKDAHFMLTNPQVFQGPRQRIRHAGEGPKLMLPFETPMGICFSEFSITHLHEMRSSRGLPV